MCEEGGRGGERGGSAFYYTYIYSGKRESCEGPELVGVDLNQVSRPCVQRVALAALHVHAHQVDEVWHVEGARNAVALIGVQVGGVGGGWRYCLL